ncbi:hypothetical protein FB451DRAFT_1373311 [Mycena latifolia]|nr:hypothetical protein FB451DRAFT_1373311 [Mycena latifolia]
MTAPPAHAYPRTPTGREAGREARCEDELKGRGLRGPQGSGALRGPIRTRVRKWATATHQGALSPGQLTLNSLDTLLQLRYALVLGPDALIPRTGAACVGGVVFEMEESSALWRWWALRSGSESDTWVVSESAGCAHDGIKQLGSAERHGTSFPPPTISSTPSVLTSAGHRHWSSVPRAQLILVHSPLFLLPTSLICHHTAFRGRVIDHTVPSGLAVSSVVALLL